MTKATIRRLSIKLVNEAKIAMDPEEDIDLDAESQEAIVQLFQGIIGRTVSRCIQKKQAENDVGATR